MATYREIHGRAIKSLSTDPSATTDEGQIWYNTASSTFKSIVNYEAWASGANSINAFTTRAGSGTQAANLIAGGDDPSANGRSEVEEYNGTGWTAGGALPVTRRTAAGCGPQTASIIFGGKTGPSATPGSSPESNSATSLDYNGSSWTSNPSMNTARYGLGGAGAGQSSALGFGGYGASGKTGVTEEFDGSSWSESGDLGTARYRLGCLGIQTAAVGAGGYIYPSPAVSNKTEEYNGSTWSEVTNYPTTIQGSAGCGTETAGLVAGGRTTGSGPSKVTTAMKYDGTSWTAAPSLATGRFNLSGSVTATSVAGLVNGGSDGSAPRNLTEEFTSSANVITAAAWAAGGTLGTARYLMAGFGGPTTAVCATGKTPPNTGNVEEYNGTTWSEETNVGTARGALGSAGTQTAGVIFGGYPAVTTTEEYDGSSWTGSGAMNTARGYNGGAGTQAAALSFGGYVAPANQTSVEKYDGSTWTASTALPNGGRQFATSGAGTQTAALATGAIYTSPSNNALTFEFDGSSWTSGGALNTARYGGGMAGTQSDMKYFAGSDNTKSVENYDGTSWKTDASLTTLFYNIGPAAAGTSSTAFGFGGGPPAINNSEQYSVETTAVNVKTLTQS